MNKMQCKTDGDEKMTNETKKYTGIFVEERTSINTEYEEDEYGREIAFNRNKTTKEIQIIQAETLKELFDMEDGDGDDSGSWGISIKLISKTDSKRIVFDVSDFDTWQEEDTYKLRILGIEEEEIRAKSISDGDEKND